MSILDRVRLFDGGMGTLLQDRGLEGGMPGELWNVENPDAVRAAHEGSAAAGATVLHHQHLRRHAPASRPARAR